MKLSVDKKVLLGGLRKALGVSDAKASLPILGHTVLTAEQGTLRVQATDLRLGVSTDVAVDSSEDGQGTAEAKKLFDMVRSLPDGQVKLAHAKGYLFIQGGNTKYRLPTLNAADFPVLAQVPGVGGLTLEGRVLSEVIGLVQHAICQDDTRPHLAGALLEIEGNVVTMVATDGHRLAKASRRLQGDVPKCFEATMLVPRQGVAELKRLADDATTLVLTWTDRKLFAVAGDSTLSIMLADNSFPPYKKVIPSTSTTTVKVDRAGALQAFERIALVGNQVTCSFAENKLLLTCSEAGGEGIDQIGTTQTGGQVDIGFGVGLLADIFSAIDTETLEVHLTDATQPAVVKAPGFVAVAMPRRI